MSKIQSIQNALIAINETVFQDLCDCFLISINRDYTAYSRTGSQTGKQKTRKGTPDSCFRLRNGKFVFVECSTNISLGVSKLKSDIEKCLDTDKTGISIENIAKIILCFNFNIKSDEIQILNDVLQGQNIDLELYSLDALSLELSLYHRNLANEFLGIPFDSGQVVSIEKFIEEYDKVSKGIATPLNNPFIHREKELKELQDNIVIDDLVILYGAPGIGKTKLALEAIKEFIKKNTSYNAFCISYKSASLIEDLNQYLHMDRDYILFVDDANRIDSFSQIIGFYKSHRKGNLKILITVRDYAYCFVEKFCGEMQYTSYTIHKLTDEHIIDIIKAEPFNILNPRYHKEITRIADGNPRLAIMTALLAIEEQSLQVLHDVSELFERYFSTFINDDGSFAKAINIKILGLTAFFHTLPYKDKDVIMSILETFEIEYDTFIDHIDILEKLELVEIQFGYVKIPEQNLSTYFFYKAFVKENLLSFEVLLDRYFRSNKARFSDCIIPANNTFGYDNVINKIKPALRKYFGSINSDKEKVLDFLSVFYFYLQEEALGYVYDIIENMQERDISDESFNYIKDEYSFKNNRIIELLGKLFYIYDNLKDVIELSFEYVRKQPQYYSELIDKIRDNLTFKIQDADFGFKRQRLLYEVLIDGVKQKINIYTKAFYELSKTFLLFEFEQTEAKRNHSFSFYYYSLPCNKYIKEFRKDIWECINTNFTDDAFPLLENYVRTTLGVVKNIMAYDIPFVCSIIENHLDPTSLVHCKYVQNLMRWCKREDVITLKLKELSRTYTNPTYEMYLKINWEIYKGEGQYQFDNYTEFEKLKEKELKESFSFKNKQEIDSFYNKFIFIFETDSNRYKYYYEKTLDIVVTEAFEHNFELGLYFIGVIIKKNPIEYIPNKAFRVTLLTEQNTNSLWSKLQQHSSFDNKEIWEMSFYHYIPDSLICDKYIQAVKHTISNWKSTSLLNLRSIKKFFVVDPNLLNDIFEIIAEKNENNEIIHISGYDLEDIFMDLLEANIELGKRIYIKQAAIQHHFDYQKGMLSSLLIKDSKFLIDYINALYFNNSTKCKLDNDSVLSIVWNIDSIEDVLIEVFEMFCKEKPYFVSKHFCNSFFRNMSVEAKERAGLFLLDYCKKNYNDTQKINIIVDIARNSMKEYYSRILLLYISLTQDKDMFSEIYWCLSEGVYAGDVIIGDVEAAKWHNVLSIVNQSNIGYRLIPIKQFINEQIEICQRSAEKDRRYRFIER